MVGIDLVHKPVGVWPDRRALPSGGTPTRNKNGVLGFRFAYGFLPKEELPCRPVPLSRLVIARLRAKAEPLWRRLIIPFWLAREDPCRFPNKSRSFQHSG